MKRFLLVISLALGVYCQLIFPDDFETTGDVRPQNGNTRRPFPTFPQNMYDNVGTNYPMNNYHQQAKTLGAPNNNNNNYDRLSSVLPSRPPAIGTPDTMTAERIYWGNHVNNIIVRGVMNFALDMDRAIDDNQRESSVGPDRDNIVFSPVSLVATLAMVLLGSNGKTFDEVVKILGLSSGVDISGHSEMVHQMLGLLLNSIDTKLPLTANGSQVTIANGIFVQADYPIRPEFLAISNAVYNNEVINVDFMRQSGSAQEIINNWVDMRTHGKIRNILAQAPAPDTKVIFTSALYFSGEWERYFISSATKRKPFTLASGQTVDVDMMYNVENFPYYEDRQLGVKILGLAYKNLPPNPGQSSLFDSTMYILLPTSEDPSALKTLESRLTPDLIERLISNMKVKRCIVGLPRMKLSSTLSLNRALQSLGLTTLFVPDQANLALLSAGPNGLKNHDLPSTSDSLIFTRINNEEPATTGTTHTNNTRRTNYFRYEDKRGGYKIEQWNNGVFVEKISKSQRRKRQITSAVPDRENYKRSKRQSRPIDNDFVKFIERQGFPNYGLDALRNNAHLVNPGLFASDVIHKVEIDVTETGTVAAAATSVVIERSGGAFVVANRPFTFFIRHEPSRLVLFWGSINKPTPNYP
ncbi:antithrombin-III [Fopius arisanus]|uniref:Antithrombin-III n=1 Tax=Fopius arisanus TaxID=64838 RepID=A0A9R1SX16_9HYME|nr:PREDICTED: antithrombin-III [Fopius arisanus]